MASRRLVGSPLEHAAIKTAFGIGNLGFRQIVQPNEGIGHIGKSCASAPVRKRRVSANSEHSRLGSGKEASRLADFQFAPKHKAGRLVSVQSERLCSGPLV